MIYKMILYTNLQFRPLSQQKPHYARQCSEYAIKTCFKKYVYRLL